jgi:hypothetical protein
MVYEGDSAGHAFWMSNVNRWCYMPVYANGGYSMMNYIGMTIGKDVVKVVGFMDVLREAGATMDHLLMDCTIPDYDHFDYTLKGIKGDIRVIGTHQPRDLYEADQDCSQREEHRLLQEGDRVQLVMIDRRCGSRELFRSDPASECRGN